MVHALDSPLAALTPLGLPAHVLRYARQALFARSEFSEKEARDLIRVLVSTLEYIHDHDICPRDLKPEARAAGARRTYPPEWMPCRTRMSPREPRAEPALHFEG